MNPNVTFSFVGDISFARDIKEYYDSKNYANIFNSTKKVLTSTDITVINLESAFGSNKQKYGKNISLVSNTRALKEAIPVLNQDNNLVISLANNHALDAGPEKFKETIDIINEMASTNGSKPTIIGVCNGCKIVDGDKECVDMETTKYTYSKLNINGVKVGIISFSQWFPVFVHEKMIKQRNKDVNYLPCVMYGPTGIHHDFLKNSIAKIRKQVDILISYVHFREEYHLEPSNTQIKICETLTDLGVDMVVGSGPHVVQDFMEINGKPCFPSLGNFVFDSHVHKKNTHQSIILQAELYKSNGSFKWKFRKINCQINKNGAPKIIKILEWFDYKQHLIPNISLSDFLHNFEKKYGKWQGWSKRRHKILQQNHIYDMKSFVNVINSSDINSKVGENYTLKTIQTLRQHIELFKMFQFLLNVGSMSNKSTEWAYNTFIVLVYCDINDIESLRMSLNDNKCLKLYSHDLKILKHEIKFYA